MHTLLICAPADSAEALGPPLAACARTLTHALMGDAAAAHGGANELLLAAMAGVLGRALLRCSPLRSLRTTPRPPLRLRPPPSTLHPHLHPPP